MPNFAIQLDSIRQHYTLFATPFQQLLHACGINRIPGFRSRPTSIFHALNDVTLRIERGERVGILGRNGAGKTTLLKLITGNFTPTEGRVEIIGKVQSLMDAGVGFHPDLTGIENIRASMIYNGLSAEEAKTAEADIIEFCELGDFIQQPIKTYSLGMVARLGFATATAIKPDILIVDEVLGAGDGYFSLKSSQRMKQLTSGGVTLLLVSHSTTQLVQFCDRVIWLDKGKIIADGDALTVVKSYERYIRELDNARLQKENAQRISNHDSEPIAPPHASPAENSTVSRWHGRGGLKLTRVRILDSEQNETNVLLAGSDFKIVVDFLSTESAELPIRYHICFYTIDGKCVSMQLSEPETVTFQEGGDHSVTFAFDHNILGHGEYVITIALYRYIDFSHPEMTQYYDLLDRSFQFKIVSPFPLDPSVVYLSGRWQGLTGRPLSDFSTVQLADSSHSSIPETIRK